MRLKHSKTLITGKPGIGKTTLIQKIVHQMKSVNTVGFYTTEIRHRGSRFGFKLQGLNGKCLTLSHVEIDSPDRIGKYGVDTVGFEVFLRTLDLLNPDMELIVIDEIGKMELFSNLFRSMVCDVLNSDKKLLASIALKGDEFIRKIKQRSDIRLFEVTHENRDHMTEAIME